jgi:hypothetical protein
VNPNRGREKGDSGAAECFENSGPDYQLLCDIAPGRTVSSSWGQFSATTYHYDNYRTGWNSQESVLTPANVGSSSFGLLKKVALDDQVDAQPLVFRT